MKKIDPDLNLRSAVHAVASNVEDSRLEDELLDIAERVYDAPGAEILRDLDQMIGRLESARPEGLERLRDRVDVARRAL